MQFIVFILAYPLLWVISILPMRALYLISDMSYLFIYYIIGYRKKVVRNNLELCFPKKNKRELRDLEKKSFRHFVDVFMEFVKSFSITEKELTQRLTLTNPEILDKYFDANKSVVFISGHYANWEWVPFIVESRLNYHLNVVYKKLANTHFDKLVRRTRKKFGVSVFSTKDFYPEILRNIKNNKIGAYGFIADQSPKWNKVKYWGNFMDIEIPVITGPESIAKKLDLPVFYFKTERIRRGVYECSFVLLEENPKHATPYELTNKSTKELEKQIRKAPEFYFWTHKRFKHIGKKLSE